MTMVRMAPYDFVTIFGYWSMTPLVSWILVIYLSAVKTAQFTEYANYFPSGEVIAYGWMGGASWMMSWL